MIATAAWDNKAKLLDFGTGKVLYTGETSDGRNLQYFHLNQFYTLIRGRLFGMLYLSNDKARNISRKEKKTKK